MTKSMADHYTWILTLNDEEPDTELLKEELTDFLERRRIRPTYCSDELNERSQMTVAFHMDKSSFKDAFNDIIGFEMAGFRTTSVYIRRDGEWTKLWKKGQFF